MKKIRMGCALVKTDTLQVRYVEELKLIEVKVITDGYIRVTAMALTLDGLHQLIDELDDLAAEIEYDEYVEHIGDEEDE